MINVLFKNPYKYFKRVVFEKPFDFRSRASRSEWWYFWLGSLYFSFIFSLLIMIILILASVTSSHDITILLSIPAIILLIPIFSVSIRRFHDCNQSGKLFVLLYLLGTLHGVAITFAKLNGVAMSLSLLLSLTASLILFYFYIKPPTPGENKYGPQPED